MIDTDKKLKVIIAGGGTGGHVFPALTVADELKKRKVEPLFIGTKKGLESRLVHVRGWKIEYLSSPRWKGEGIFKRILALFRIPFAVLRALRIIAKFDPDVVIGVGGYASAPVLMAAAIQRVPILIMEQNSIPGLANRILGRVSKKICLSFPTTEKYFKPGRTVVTGNPVRQEIRDACKSLPSFQDTFVVMCFGGSQGAKSINEAMFSSLRFLRNKRHGLKIIHQVGFNMDIEVARDIYKREGFDAEVHRFIDDMADCYSRAHLVISRAGATSIAELMVTGRPAVLVPYPFSANGHQEENAKFVAERGGAVMVLNKYLTGEKISELITDFMNHPDHLSSMNRAMLEMSSPNAALAIVEECFKLSV